MPNAEQRLDAYAHQLSGGLRQTGHDRHGARLLAQAPHRRRAHHRARRHHPGPDPRPARPPPPGAPHGRHPDHPRHGRDRRAGRPRPRHVRRQDRRGRRRTTELFTAMRHPYSEALLASVAEARPGPLRPARQHPGPAARPLPAHRRTAASPPAAATPRTTAARASPQLVAGRRQSARTTWRPASTRSTSTRRPSPSGPRRWPRRPTSP